MSDQNFSIRRATADDAVIITHHRRSMFADMGERDTVKLDAMSVAFKKWVSDRLACDEYLGWFVVNEQEIVVAGAGLWLIAWPPTANDLSGQRGYIFNVYTQPAFRRCGLARRLMQAILAYCRENKIKVVALHASDQGRSLYESLGFKQTNEMRLWL
ncbi:MAG: GNAT family N-acetyltransferase [Chloroflexi bacterium]|nr:GNAT family N-acetyltransferase [Chloroflexota bacterium]